ncbi:MAG: DUF3592 domain-containing protein [bacterium]|nr:DUF3592 domain-containing protein [bacterium]
MNLLFIIGLAVSLWLMVSGGRVLFLTFRSEWSEVEPGSMDVRLKLHSSGIYGTKTYRPFVKYTYEFMGAAYSSDRYAFSESEDSGDENIVRKICADLVSNKTMIHVNKGNPRLSVLKLRDAKSSVSQAFAFVIGGFLIFTFVLFFWVGY